MASLPLQINPVLMYADERVHEALEAAGSDRRGQESTPAGALLRVSGC